MTKNQEDYLSMSQTTFSFLIENTAVWQRNLPIAETIQSIGTENDAIIDLQADQEKSHKGVTDSKQNDRTALEDIAHLVANILSFCGGKTKNFDLQGQVAEATIDLSRQSGIRLIGITDVVLKAGADNLEAATPYGLTQDMLDTLKVAKDAFVKQLNAPRSAINSASTATDMLAAGIDNLHTGYQALDKGMVQFNGNTTFYNGYKKARMIVHSATRHLAITAAITDTAGNPVQDAKITILNGDEKVLRKSSPLGNIRVQNLLEGEHVMTLEKPGFEPLDVTFIVAPPETARVDVVMK